MVSAVSFSGFLEGLQVRGVFRLEPCAGRDRVFGEILADRCLLSAARCSFSDRASRASSGGLHRLLRLAEVVEVRGRRPGGRAGARLRGRVAIVLVFRRVIVGEVLSRPDSQQPLPEVCGCGWRGRRASSEGENHWYQGRY